MARHSLSREFRDRIDEQQVEGLTCDGQSAFYIPFSVLLEFWDIQRIRTLSDKAGITQPPALVRNEYLLVFSILVIASVQVEECLEYFDTFVKRRTDDATLPLTLAPSWMPGDAQGCRLFEAFSDAQWKFCPVLLHPRQLSNTLLDRRCILPFSDKNSIGSSSRNREATVCSVGVHARAHSHLPNASQVLRRVVLKTYSQADQDSYEKERRAYAALSTISTNILQCLGSFHWMSADQERTSTLIFEYAERGSLLDLFEKGRNPFKPSDVIAMWKGFLDLMKGLETIHEQAGLKAIHQDLKPSNILVFPPDGTKGNFSYVFKISDFGSCYMRSRDSPHDGQDAIYNRTTRTYRAPELQLGDFVKYHVRSEIDMWSIGCILIEAAVWITFGEEGRQEFSELRRQETALIHEHRIRGTVDCFHDGHNILKSVWDFKNRIEQYRRREHNISLEVFELALNHLLVDGTRRLKASQFHSHLIGIISKNQITTSLGEHHQSQERESPGSGPMSASHLSQRSRNSYLTLNDWMASAGPSRNPSTGSIGTRDPTRVSSAKITSPTQPPPDTFVASNEDTPPSYPHVTIEDLWSWREYSKVDHKLPGWKQVKMQLQNRDFIFVVDNSTSMQRHRNDVLKFVYCLGYLVKQLDKNGLQVLMTSDPRHIETLSSSTKVRDFVEREFQYGVFPCNMEQALEQAMNVVFQKLQRLAPSGWQPRPIRRVLGVSGKAKPFNILVFTDGVWDSSENGVSGTDYPIERCIEVMKSEGVSRTNVAIQFLRFGDSEKGKRRLTFLDDELKKREQNRGYDIVDHKSQNDSIWEILIGAVLTENDDKGQYQ